VYVASGFHNFNFFIFILGAVLISHEFPTDGELPIGGDFLRYSGGELFIYCIICVKLAIF